MNKIPKCMTRNFISQPYLKLTKKLTKEAKITNNKYPKQVKSLNTSKHYSKETSAYSLISTKKISTLTTTSSKNNTIIIHKNVRWIIVI